jgi:RimJ/RimL family protein N-acetyltransferase
VITIQRIKPEQWQLLRELRLAALLDSPDAFGQSYDEALGQPDAEWRAAAQTASDGDRRTWFIARDMNGSAVGLVQARRRPPVDCLLFSMWVAPSARRSGTGSQLVDAVADWGREWGARRVVLWVIAGNEAAMRFYDRIGFKVLDAGPDAQSGYAYGAIALDRAIDQPWANSSGETQR